MSNLYTVSSTPHIRSKASTENIMLHVLIALAPAAFCGIFLLGWRALVIMALCMASCILAEYCYQKLTKQTITIRDNSALVTGLLLAFNLPSTVPFWLPVLGAFFAVFVVKQIFGGLGQNFMNPALASRAFLLASFPAIMTKFPEQKAMWDADATTGATILSAMKEAGHLIAPNASEYLTLLFGKTAGSIGETSAIALLIGGIYLLVRKIISWRIPVAYLVAFFVFTYIFGRDGAFTGIPYFEILAGGILLGAFFMATDYATSPITPKGQLIFGVGCGLLTVIIRIYGGYPEGVSYAILIMNLCVPFIDKYTRPRVYGTRRATK